MGSLQYSKNSIYLIYSSYLKKWWKLWQQPIYHCFEGIPYGIGCGGWSSLRPHADYVWCCDQLVKILMMGNMDFMV